jgi:hypothetical protein
VVLTPIAAQGLITANGIFDFETNEVVVGVVGTSALSPLS